MTNLNELSGGVQKPSRRPPPPVPPRPVVRSQAVPTQPLAHPSTSDTTDHLTEEKEEPEVAIAIMGTTGSGKSTFINLISGSNLRVGKGLRSCTEIVQIPGSFNLAGRHVILIDTPGFDDTTRSDTDVLKSIAAFLETSYEHGAKLAGVMYFHRISDFRMTGTSKKNFGMFQKLCGEKCLQNVVIVTNMWGEVDPKVGIAREEELREEFFKSVLDKGARMVRHEGTVPSAEAIVQLFFDNTPLPLRFQEELVDENKDISETDAGEELNREINAQIKKHQEEMLTLREDLEQAMKDKDEETRKELEIEAQKVQRQIEKFQNDAKRLGPDYRKEKEKLKVHLGRMESEAGREADRVTAQYQRQIDELRGILKANVRATQAERAIMLAQINELTRMSRASRPRRRRRGIFSTVGGFLDYFMP